MKHPTPAQCRMVARCIELSSGRVDMSKPSMIREPNCGTIACHAGHYYIGRNIFYRKEQIVFESMAQMFGDTQCAGEKHPEGSHIATYKKGGRRIPYTEGANQMAKDLGFESHCELTKWAKSNPELWGNIFGGGLFSAESAFTAMESAVCFDLQCIVKHWYGVAGRIEAMITDKERKPSEEQQALSENSTASEELETA